MYDAVYDSALSEFRGGLRADTIQDIQRSRSCFIGFGV